MSNQVPPEITLKEVNQVLSQTIKQDETNKSLLFLGMLSAFTENSQINISLNAPSSSGKTYLTQEVAKLFPEEDKVVFSNATPTALFYGKTGFDKEREARIVDLERKILVFLEQPDTTLQTNLRSILSHDSKESIYYRTNRNQKGANRAEKIIIKGFPATVFCSASQQIDEQEATRALTLSPEITPEKIQSAIENILQKNADPTVSRQIENDPSRIALKERIRLIRDMHIDDIRIPDPSIIKDKFCEFTNGSFKPRHMRDIEHLTQIIKSIALLNIWHREKNGVYCANEDDMNEAFRLWNDIAKTQELNITPYLYDFYENYIMGAYRLLPPEQRRFGISRQEIIQYHLAKTKILLSDANLLRNILPALRNSGLVSFAQHPNDRRQTLIIPSKTIGTEGCMT